MSNALVPLPVVLPLFAAALFRLGLQNAMMRFYQHAATPAGDAPMLVRVRHLDSAWDANIVTWNSHEPNSRLTRLVCLPCQPIPAASASGFSMTGAVSTNTFTSPPARATILPAISFSLPFITSW